MRRHFVCASVVVGLSYAFAYAQTPSAHSGTPQAVEQPHPAVAAPPVVIARDGRLTIKVTGASVSALLPVLSEKTGVKIVEAVALGDVRVSIAVEAAPLEDALRQILSPYDAFFFYGRTATNKLPASLQAVWVYPRGQGASLAPIDANTAVSTTEFIVGTSDPDPAVRLAALEKLVERTNGTGPAVEALNRALQDPDENVRALAIETAVDNGVELPEKDLAALALADASPHIRLIALKALVNSPQIKQVAEAAIADSSADVRDMAREILESLARRKEGYR